MTVATEPASPQTTSTATGRMKALVYHGPGQRAWEETPRPTIQNATDAIVRITTSTICGTDLHILKGDLPGVTPGRILGHEGIGVVTEVGAAVTAVHPGDRVIISCVTACGKCDYCRKGMYSHCRDGGWILGNTIDGTQAEFVRIPHADTSLHRAPFEVPEESLVLLSDILPTAFECGVLNGQIRPGDTVAIVGAGPIGLAAVLTSRFFSPSRIIVVDRDANRLATARTLGATHVIEPGADAAERVRALSNGEGVDVAIEAVGVPETFDLCQQIVGPGGRLANVGVHGRSVTLHLEKLWSHNITLTTRLVDAVSTPMLLGMLASEQLDPAKLVTHRFRLSQAMEAYDTFADAAKSHALKVALRG